MRIALLLLALTLAACGQRSEAPAPAAQATAAPSAEAITESPPPLPAASWQEFAKQRGFESATSAEQARIWEEFRSAMRDTPVTPAQTRNLTPISRDVLISPNFPQARVYGGGWPHDHPCTVDCSGHEAGYQWAEDNGITDPDDCSGNSTSFIEGCQAYAEGNTSTDSPESE